MGHPREAVVPFRRDAGAPSLGPPSMRGGVGHCITKISIFSAVINALQLLHQYTELGTLFLIIIIFFKLLSLTHVEYC